LGKSFENSKTFRARLSATHHAHLRAPRPRDPGRCLGARRVDSNSAGRRPVEPSRRSPTRAPLLPLPFSRSRSPLALHTECTPCHFALLCSPLRSRCRVITAEAVAGKPRPSWVGVRREHLPYPFSPFEQGLAARSAPAPGSRAVSTVATLPPVRGSAALCVTFLPCARASTHSPIAYCPGFGPGKPPPMPRFKLPSPPPSLIR
jgi:hypothetical protein